MNRLIRWAEQTPSIVSALSGIAGGLAMALYEMTATAIAEGDFWAPLHMIAAAVPESELIGSGAGRAALGLLIHLITAAFWGTRYGYVFSYAPRGLHGPLSALPLGLLWGAVVWLLMGIIIGPALNPLLRHAHPVHYFVGHLAFGLVTGWVLHTWTRRRPQALANIPP